MLNNIKYSHNNKNTYNEIEMCRSLFTYYTVFIIINFILIKLFSFGMFLILNNNVGNDIVLLNIILSDCLTLCTVLLILVIVRYNNDFTDIKSNVLHCMILQRIPVFYRNNDSKDILYIVFYRGITIPINNRTIQLSNSLILKSILILIPLIMYISIFIIFYYNNEWYIIFLILINVINLIYLLFFYYYYMHYNPKNDSKYALRLQFNARNLFTNYNLYDIDIYIAPTNNINIKFAIKYTIKNSKEVIFINNSIINDKNDIQLFDTDMKGNYKYLKNLDQNNVK